MTISPQRDYGNTQQVESKFGDLKLKPTSWITSNSPPPKIVFNRLNGKRYHSAAAQKSESPVEGFTPAHEENVRFVYEGGGAEAGGRRQRGAGWQPRARSVLREDPECCDEELCAHRPGGVVGSALPCQHCQPLMTVMRHRAGTRRCTALMHPELATRVERRRARLWDL
uniref:Uncharacterized protein n=1 Tax=Astatotilapia calliptera TaxID=8154 RepID=A0AAX7US10_ASTCA